MSFERTVIDITVVHGLVHYFYKCIIDFDEYDMSNVTTTVKDYIAVSNQY